MIKAVIFDKDGVIVHTTELYFERWKKTFSKFNKNLTKEFHLRFVSGRKAKETIKKHLNQNITEEDLTKELQEQLTFTINNYKKYVKPVKGIEAFLKKLKNDHIPLALATSSRKETSDYAIDMLNIRDFFSVIITGDDLESLKPNPEIYIHIAKKLGIKPKDCVVFEDSISGVEAAKKAGMKIVLVMTSHTEDQIPTKVDLAISDFTQIKIQDIKKL